MHALARSYFRETKSAYQRLAQQITPARADRLSDLQKKLHITLKQPALLDKALTHRSYFRADKRKGDILFNQRLEFLGDSVLATVISEHLFCSFPSVDEGGLSKMKAALVSRTVLARRARELELGDYIRLGKGERKSGARDSDAILSDTLEAVLGAVFLDRGYRSSMKCILHLFSAEFETLLTSGSFVNYKSLLQERIQKESRQVPEYRLDKREGPSHKARFHVSVLVDGKVLGQGTGYSKKEAEINGAAAALKKHYHTEG